MASARVPGIVAIELATSGIVFLKPAQVALGVIFGVMIGLGGSLVSVGRHLRNV